MTHTQLGCFFTSVIFRYIFILRRIFAFNHFGDFSLRQNPASAKSGCYVNSSKANSPNVKSSKHTRASTRQKPTRQKCQFVKNYNSPKATTRQNKNNDNLLPLGHKTRRRNCKNTSGRKLKDQQDNSCPKTGWPDAQKVPKFDFHFYGWINSI